MMTADMETRLYLPTLRPVVRVRPPAAIKNGRKVVDIAAITIEQIRTAKGEYAYEVRTRQKKYLNVDGLLALRRAITVELASLGVIKDPQVVKLAWYYRNKEAVNAKRQASRAANIEASRAKERAAWNKSKDIQNLKRRHRYAEKQALKKALA